MQAARHSGSCLCGGVRFEVDGDLEPIQVCYCGQCRKAQGTPLATNIPVRLDAVRFLSGEELFARYESSPGKDRVFCSRCGSPLFSERKSLPGVIRLRAGLLNDPVATKPAMQFHTTDRSSWWPLREDLPSIEPPPPPREGMNCGQP